MLPFSAPEILWSLSSRKQSIRMVVDTVVRPVPIALPRRDGETPGGASGPEGASGTRAHASAASPGERGPVPDLATQPSRLRRSLGAIDSRRLILPSVLMKRPDHLRHLARQRAQGRRLLHPFLQLSFILGRERARLAGDGRFGTQIEETAQLGISLLGQTPFPFALPRLADAYIQAEIRHPLFHPAKATSRQSRGGAGRRDQPDPVHPVQLRHARQSGLALGTLGDLALQFRLLLCQSIQCLLKRSGGVRQLPQLLLETADRLGNPSAGRQELIDLLQRRALDGIGTQRAVERKERQAHAIDAVRFGAG